MERWYEALITREREAVGCFLNDYSAIASALARLSGRVLDVGGGIGVTRQYLRNGVDYVNLDPSVEWLDPAWRGLIPDFPVLAEPMSFVRGTGERLPFRPETFDAVLSLWSLNHASSPELVLRECRGVLRPGGTLYLVMEDMEPTWRDIARRAAQSRRAVGRKALNALLRRRWPVQPDHIRIDEEELLRWSSEGFSVARREWVGNGLGYLTFELTRL